MSNSGSKPTSVNYPSNQEPVYLNRDCSGNDGQSAIDKRTIKACFQAMGNDKANNKSAEGKLKKPPRALVFKKQVAINGQSKAVRR
ncbi:hypothetical protein TTRE_0000632701 [Trichuris trichiura]|uniref:Uncharacterized protein n=1 Tax=Trichuris trichiura TaxID=36087 RepID=A0A077ZC97_TRITR|nr:hypothetical protein TTRE_0000632701 [Trichuris trichiura]